VKVIIALLLFFLLWTPRILCVFFSGLVLLLGDFAPALLVIVLLVLSWRWSFIGGIIFLVAEIAYMVSTDHWDAMVYIPLFLISVLFLLSWLFREEIRNAQEIFWWGENKE
jgi:hypothetical protein